MQSQKQRKQNEQKQIMQILVQCKWCTNNHNINKFLTYTLIGVAM